MTNEKKPTMLEQARKVKTQGRGRLHISDELVELVFAWARNEINMTQIAETLHEAKVITKPTSQLAYPKISEVLQYCVMGELLVPAGWLKDAQ